MADPIDYLILKAFRQISELEKEIDQANWDEQRRLQLRKLESKITDHLRRLIRMRDTAMAQQHRRKTVEVGDEQQGTTAKE